MRSRPKTTSLIILTCVALLLAACQSPQYTITPSPILATLTPFQPIPPTATRTPIPTATPTVTPSPTATATNTPTPEPTATEEPAQIEPPVNPPDNEVYGSVTVPILLYHHISETVDTQYNVRPEIFAEQVKWLHDHGYTTITISDVTRLITRGGNIPDRPVVITFDDGYLDVYQNAFPILQEYGYVATFFIIGETVDTRGNLSSKKLLNLIDSGWEIGSHSMTHIDLNQGDNWEYEIRGSKEFLEDKLGVAIQTFAYPYGLADHSVIQYTINSGYTSAVGLGSSVIQDSYNLYYLSRKEVKSWYGLDFFESFMPWTN